MEKFMQKLKPMLVVIVEPVTLTIGCLNREIVSLSVFATEK